LIADFTLPAAGTVATQLGIPWWTSLPSPCVLECGESPPAYFGGLKPRDGMLATLRDRCARALTRQFKRLVFFGFRKRLEEIGIDRPYRDDGTETAYSNQRILAFGSAALEFCKKWPAHVSLMPMPLYSPPMPGLAPQYAGNRSHVLVTLGTHLRFAKDEVASAVRRLARQMPNLEFHFTDGAMRSNPTINEGNFTRFAFVNYAQHLARYALIIHHGGSGVMHHSLAAGCPAVVYPIDYDQFDNAARLEASGLALRLRKLEDLESVVRRALGDLAMRDRCRRFASHMDNDTASILIPAVSRCVNRGWGISG
jgi:UDP:flavonoid glycosyltransferase YjiC (YdhE family)